MQGFYSPLYPWFLSSAPIRGHISSLYIYKNATWRLAQKQRDRFPLHIESSDGREDQRRTRKFSIEYYGNCLTLRLTKTHKSALTLALALKKRQYVKTNPWRLAFSPLCSEVFLI